MFDILFFSTFLFTSLTCYVIDINYPLLRVKKETTEIIKKEYVNMLPQVSLNVFIGTFILNRIGKYYNNNNNNYFIINFILWFIFSDIIFFFVHKNLHKKQFYWLHKKHHEYIYTYSIGAIYSSCFEFIFGNVLPLSLPIILFDIPKHHANIIVVFSTFFTVFVSHGGYFKNNKHLEHHITRTKYFGLGFTDRLYSLMF